jgi:hypothetical protein
MKTFSAKDDGNGEVWWDLETKQRSASEMSALAMAIKYVPS